MSIDNYKQQILQANLYDSQILNEITTNLKHNICQNLRIARILSGISPDDAAQYLGLEPQSLRRIEAENDRDEVSTRVLILAIVMYEPDANFYFKNWKDNELLINR